MRLIGIGILSVVVGTVALRAIPSHREAVARGAAAAAPVDFAKSIQPILKEACYDCHGPAKQKGKLRLDSRELALSGGGSGPAIIPGNSTDSYLVKRILGEGDEDRMPIKHDPLEPQQIATIRAWIDQGAVWPDVANVAGAAIAKHWSYQKPLRPALPAVKQNDWVRNPIDTFVLARLEKEGMTPSPEADRVTLIRRLSLDLIGLPPTPAEVDAFVADHSERAYENLVERLLASPHYGERWGRHWLDLAHYADTNGYEKDRTRSIWPFRDWVIHALNSDQPFDQFTIEQIAGDMLPNATASQRIATGFFRNTMTNEEGGIDVEEFRYKNIVDRIQTTGAAWLGTTMHCCQCHNHKYDPITQKEYYQFYALLDGADEPELDVPSERIAAQRAAVEAKVAPLRQSMVARYKTLAATRPAESQEAWEKTAAAKAVHWRVLEPRKFERNYGGTITKLADQSLLFTGDNLYRDDYKLEFSGDLKDVRAIRLEVLPDAAQPKGGPGRSPEGGWLLSEFSAQLRAETGSTPTITPLKLERATADVGANAANAIDGKRDTHWVMSKGDAKPHEIVFNVKPVEGKTSGTLAVTVTQNYHQQENIGRLRLSVTSDEGTIAANGFPADVESALLIEAKERRVEQQAAIDAYFLSITPLLAAERKQADELERAEPSYATTLVLEERRVPRVTHIHRRGEFLNLGAEVTPSVPAVLPPLPAGQPRNRLTFARWLVSPENPLTPRVVMNRMWATYFGRGIVRSVEDFGAIGEAPSHPQLLDWLATEFVKQHWSQKAMHRLIVTSATYRQSSRATAEQQRRDPVNELLARGPRLRVEAEVVRDIALSAAGLLTDHIGGPSVYPPQPEGVGSQSYSNSAWPTSKGAERFRRGMYTFLRRTAPNPQLITFDAPTSEVVCSRRIRSDTPLQALTTLNDTAFVEAAQGLANRVVREGPSDDAGRVEYAFRLCVARSPDATEREQILSFYRGQLERFKAKPAMAKQVAVSEAVPLVIGADVAEMAAWTTVSRALLNLDETIVKE
jgi:hypothetical protein